MARPRLNPEHRVVDTTSTIAFRISKDDYAVFKEEADAAGKSISSYVRDYMWTQINPKLSGTSKAMVAMLLKHLKEEAVDRIPRTAS